MSLVIISHRGFWRSPEEKNALVAFERTVRESFGTETDVRDRDGELVIAHDIPDKDARPWTEVLDLFERTGLPLAVNIKADGLSQLLAAAMRGRALDWFAFDMSAPETVRYAEAGLPYFTRHSDIEKSPVLYETAAGVWLDAFKAVWFDEAVIEGHLARGKRVCVVSPELHGRPYDEVWAMLRDLEAPEGSLMLCTDHPDLARAYFAS
jgi:hypothetical protein